MNQLYLIEVPRVTGYVGVLIISAVNAAEAFSFAYERCKFYLQASSGAELQHLTVPLTQLQTQLQESVFVVPNVIGQTEKKTGLVYAHLG